MPDPAAEEGEALLSTLETPASDEPDVAPTRRVGLEHTGLRPFGKVGIVLFIAGVLIGGAVTIAFDRPRSRGPGRCARGRRGSARLERADGTPAG